MKNLSKKAEQKKWDIVGMGNPLLDVVINIEEEMLAELKIKKGSMKLISQSESRKILKKLAHLEQILALGGSASNTISGANLLGSRTAFLGVVGKDEYGKAYESKMEKEGTVSHLSQHAKDKTGHVIILITPDGERTMLAHLGAAINFSKAHLKKAEIAASKILHIEAYQLEDKNLRQTVLHAIKIAKSGQVLVSLDLADTGLIERNKKLFKNIVKKHVDVVFANEQEAMAFADEKDPIKALHKIATSCQIAVVKLGEKGSLIKKGQKVFQIAPHKVKMENTNGAGDMYAGGILHGLINELDLQEAGEMASHVSALVVASPGARLDKKHFGKIRKYRKR
jgi:sugar/nucleoside kinase (ribokinase family)